MAATPEAVVKTQRPAHVPAHLVWDNSLEAFSLESPDPYESIARLHDGPDIIWSPYGYRGEPSWILTRFEHIQQVYQDRRFSFGTKSDIQQLLNVPWKLTPFEADPPLHGLYRRLLNPWFSPVAVKGLDSMIRKVCDDLMDSFTSRGSCEFMAEFASLFPAKIFMSFMGLDETMLPQFLDWANNWMRGETYADRAKAASDIATYLEGVARDRRANPREDLATAIVQADIDGRPVTAGEVIGMYFILYLGGLDTVVSSLGWHVRHLASTPELQQRLRETPRLIPQAVDEFLRAFGVTTTRKTVTEDLEFFGVQMRAGDSVMTPAPLASRDPRQYASPHVIDVDRRPRLLTFGTGIHTCLGMHLARRELRIVLEAITKRMPNLRVVDAGAITHHTTGVWGLDSLPLSWG